MNKNAKVCLYLSDSLGSYGFPDGHPFGPDRQAAFWREAQKQGLDKKVEIKSSRPATREEIERFHTPEHVDRVIALSKAGYGFIDYGDTPAFPGVYEATAHVVGAALDGLKCIMQGECKRTFQPIGGLHHARRERAAGFCVFNDLGVVVETLRSQYKVKRMGYVDIDVHHGDGMFYPFESDPDLIYADIHEDGHFLYPGTGFAEETGKGKAAVMKLNIPMAPGAGDSEFLKVWPKVEALLRDNPPELILFQCGADSIAGDPLAHLQYSPATHAYAAKRLCVLANEFCEGRIMAFGGGGYDRHNLAQAWSGVVREMLAQ
ncbi:MAG TPA: acetoin utilization protein AcuC [Burkholderiales bacterium]